ncbi:MAG: hypothetical protein KJ623_03220 [Nanoarchaeota archaeon]|nr:hypothetical protein [Nanoarchaeota archaeon]MBU0963256.1 hypothetical protein [Nanoarchaeota archaeon]
MVKNEKFDKKSILNKLEKIKKTEEKIKFLEDIIEKLNDDELKEELKFLIEEIKDPHIDEVIQEQRFSNIETKKPEIKENLEQTITREEPLIKKEEVKEKRYNPLAEYGVRKTTYEKEKTESPFFDILKVKLDRAGLLPRDMIFNENEIKSIRAYMQKMDIPEDRIERYVDKIADLKHELYDPIKAKSIKSFNVDYEVE